MVEWGKKNERKGKRQHGKNGAKKEVIEESDEKE